MVARMAVGKKYNHRFIQRSHLLRRRMVMGTRSRGEVLSSAIHGPDKLDHYRHSVRLVAVRHRRILWHPTAGTYQV